MEVVGIETPAGLARAHLERSPKARGAVVLGHGAAGSVGAPDLLAVSDAAIEHRLAVALIEQPYRVAGRRSAPPAAKLDTAWISAISALLERELRGLPLVAGGRSSGARVAGRTAGALGVAGVLCLAFPLQPPRRKAASGPAASRLAELEAVSAPVLVVQGAKDRFGIPPAARRREVHTVAGDHSLRGARESIAAIADGWLQRVFAESGRRESNPP